MWTIYCLNRFIFTQEMYHNKFYIERQITKTFDVTFCYDKIEQVVDPAFFPELLSFFYSCCPCSHKAWGGNMFHRFK